MLYKIQWTMASMYGHSPLIHSVQRLSLDRLSANRGGQSV